MDGAGEMKGETNVKGTALVAKAFCIGKYCSRGKSYPHFGGKLHSTVWKTDFNHDRDTYGAHFYFMKE